ncbi:hypothetical protein ACLOJK_012380 [Asimina triloba]
MDRLHMRYTCGYNGTRLGSQQRGLAPWQQAIGHDQLLCCSTPVEEQLFSPAFDDAEKERRKGWPGEEMGRLFVVNLEGKIYRCKHCQTDLALYEDIVSRVRLSFPSHLLSSIDSQPLFPLIFLKNLFDEFLKYEILGDWKSDYREFSPS